MNDKEFLKYRSETTAGMPHAASCDMAVPAIRKDGQRSLSECFQGVKRLINP